MSDKDKIFEELLILSRHLGDSSHDWAILGEGNTSAKLDDDTFLVKASGSSLSTLTREQVCQVKFAPILEAMSGDRAVSDTEVRDLLLGSVVGGDGRMPSVETLFHASLLSLPDVSFIGHTHITSINGILCSKAGWELMQNAGRLFPDEIVVCGEGPCCVPYVDPGLPLAREIRKQVDLYIEKYGTYPKTIYMQNHGFIALGKSSREVEAIHQMADKSARVLIGTMAFGGPNWFTEETVRRIATRPDEHYRQRAIGLKVER
ncbi:MAG TPA: class II aldolase/adducin family protein [Capsulimonadaceae bacterium]|jgi:rhamnose utilization protein RhaD (predicted bifunctional aldolase and dehydrogenase)